MEHVETTAAGDKIYRAKNDVNGNSRHVVHFHAFITEADREKAQLHGHFLQWQYDLALSRARTIGGRKFHNKQFGGGIIFTNYAKVLKADIAELMANFEAEQNR